MKFLRKYLHVALASEQGTAVIETAIVTPVLLLLSLGAFDASGIVARQNELQNAADVAAGATLASSPDTAQKLATLKAVVVASTGLSSSNVDAAFIYRCGTNPNYVQSSASCASDPYTTYVQITLHDVYTPSWSKFGVGSPVKLLVVRQAIAGQTT